MPHRMRFGIFLAPFHKPGINPTLALQPPLGTPLQPKQVNGLTAMLPPSSLPHPPLLLAVLPVLLIGARRWPSLRAVCLSSAVALTLVACGGGGTANPPGPINKTYQISLTAIGAQGTTINGLPIQGAVITVQK